MISKVKNFLSGWWILVLIVVSQFTVLLIAPNEMTLGSGIKPVYLHVSLTWVGMILFLIASVLGVLVIIIGNGRLARIYRSVFYCALMFYTGGFLISLYASWLNWGGIPLQEPRIRNAINVVVVGIAAWAFFEMVNNFRLKGLSGIFPLVFILLARGSDRMVLHPDNPVRSAPIGIQTTFLVMFALALILAGWIFSQIYARSDHQPSTVHYKASHSEGSQLQN